MKKAVVIGAGIGGLASAIRMAAKNYEVTVIEQEAYPGGKMSEIRTEDFRFDTGPSLLTLPHLVEELFTLVGEKAEDYLTIRKLDESCRYFYPEGKKVHAWTSPEKFSSELESKLGEPKENTLRYLKKAKRLYHFTADLFLFSSLHRMKTFRNRKAFGTLMRPGLLDPFRSLHQANRKSFQTKEVQQIFDRYATYNAPTLSGSRHPKNHFPFGTQYRSILSFRRDVQNSQRIASAGRTPRSHFPVQYPGQFADNRRR
ncbi:phytoene desaturase family protein [Prolixibacter bellariivorans]|uniref:phytoene desaturase family protein n=1 Tax=Prolixibacter bellariivorans TaxID=314319 RepID=UPI0006872645|nr:NAD(P)-binding protein [Prolixibacter bellariivorans]